MKTLIAPRISIDGQIRNASTLQSFLASRCDWRDRVARIVRKRCGSIRVVQSGYERIRIYVCIVEGTEWRTQGTSNWGGSKRLRLYEADCVVGIEVDPRGLPIAAFDAVLDRIAYAALAVTAQALLRLGAEPDDVEAALQGTDVGLDTAVAAHHKA